MSSTPVSGAAIAPLEFAVRARLVDPGTGGGVGGTGGTGGGGGGGGSGGQQDTTPPAAAVALVKGQKLKTVLSKGLKLAITLGEAGTATVKLTVDKATARKLKLGNKAVGVGTLTKALAAGKSTVTVRLTAKARKALAKAKSVKLGVSVTAKDAAGNTGTKNGSAKLKR